MIQIKYETDWDKKYQISTTDNGNQWSTILRHLKDKQQAIKIMNFLSTELGYRIITEGRKDGE